jgi:hypothetical protein
VKKQVIVSLCVVAALLGAAGLAGAVPLAKPSRSAGHALPLLMAGAPSVVSYQGQVSLGGSPFDGKGYFKFAIVDADGTTAYWSNDGSSGGGEEPELGVQLIVTNSLFNVLLGDTSLTNMTEPLDAAVFGDPECYLRVWFSEDGSSFQQLSPDRRIAAVPYALQAERARLADHADEADDAGAVDGYLPGNTSGRIPINNGALNTNLNADRVDGQHAADLMVPSGAIVLGFQDDPRLTGAGYVDLGASVELWRRTDPTFAPTGRYDHTAVWTGTEMIVWGGDGNTGRVNSGSRYDPGDNTWMPTTTTGAPAARRSHTAVWTSSEMIVWGGYDGSYASTGGRYDLGTNTWTATTTTGAPTGRAYHTAVWTGSEMIVWGGFDGSNCVNTGRLYDPASNTWAVVSTTGAPAARCNHSAVWTGSEMIVWGGGDELAAPTYMSTGGRYDPATHTWTPVSVIDAPSGRGFHTAVWTGSEMMVWGGSNGSHDLASGGSYNPSTDTWTYISARGSPEARSHHTAVWTGSEMIVWGGAGTLNSGEWYDPRNRTWTDVTTAGVPVDREGHTAVWTDSEMIVWGGIRCCPSYLYSGGRYSRLHVYQKP